MGLTSIRQIVNQTQLAVFFRKLENAEDTGFIYGTPHPQSNYQVSYNEIWVPWCDNQQQLVEKALIINIHDDVLIYIWQSGNIVYTNQQLLTHHVSAGGKPVIYHPEAKPYFPQQRKGFTIDNGIFSGGKPIGGIYAVDGNRRLVIRPTYNVPLRYSFGVSMEML